MEEMKINEELNKVFGGCSDLDYFKDNIGKLIDPNEAFNYVGKYVISKYDYTYTKVLLTNVEEDLNFGTMYSLKTEDELAPLVISSSYLQLYEYKD